jgi:cytochrome d ubiquinol oxidase subunit II
MLESAWFALWGILWAVYFMLDGYDLGLGSLMPYLSRSDTDRRIMYNAAGPFWDGNEVWLITAGGVTFAAFPGTYAVMFSALYTPLMLILFALILRGVAFEFRGKSDSRAWRATWDACLFVGSFVPAVLFGVAFANIFAGAPITAEGVLAGGLAALINPYGLLGGVLFLLAFCLHGALWLMVRTGGDVGAELRARGGKAARILWPLVLAAAAAFLAASCFATDLWANYLAAPYLLVLPLAAVGCLLACRALMARAAWFKAWAASAGFIALAVLFGVAGLYPRLLPSSLDPAATLTAFNSASSPLTLKIMLTVALVMVPVVIAYQSWAYSRFAHPLTQEDLAYEEAY